MTNGCGHGAQDRLAAGAFDLTRPQQARYATHASIPLGLEAARHQQAAPVPAICIARLYLFTTIRATTDTPESRKIRDSVDDAKSGTSGTIRGRTSHPSDGILVALTCAVHRLQKVVRMCGICGFMADDDRLNRETLERMNEQIRRRGPDGAGYYFDGQVGLAMRRLAIIDLETGWQPIFNEDRSVCVVLNGEIYNYRELRAQLIALGHRFATGSDTEVIVHLYEEYGESLSEHLQGMFAFALWDLARRRLVLSRDRLGIKPLFVANRLSGVIFGSEIKCILASRVVKQELDLQALDEYLTYTNVPWPRTIYRDIRQLPPGTTTVYTAGGAPTTHKYWSLPEPQEDDRTEAQWRTDCEQTLREAVRSHLVSDVPVGAFLSGGVDSGLMVALMAEQLEQPVETFTVGFQEAGTSFIDERKYARALAQRYSLRHHEIEVTPNLEEIASEIVQAFDQPFADDSVVPSYYVSQVAAQRVKVALTGLGGDELFGGYRRHLGVLMGEQFARIPAPLRKHVLRPIVERLPESANSSDLADHLKRFMRSHAQPPAAKYQDSMATLTWPQRRALYSPIVAEQIDAQATEDVMLRSFGAVGSATSLDRALRTDLQRYLVDDILTLTDRLSMWHSLELRVPYLDHRLVELTMRIPNRLKIRRTTQKYLLKRIAERWLPHDMIYHRKQGFEAPMGRWLRGPLLPFFDSVVNRKSIEATGILDFEQIYQLRNEHVSLRRKNSKILFSLMMFMLWYRSTEPSRRQ